MRAFTAINVEPEDNVDDQLDNARELQIDEALKRFQAALKLHAQGPGFLDEASSAYDELFKADIFKFPQAQTDYDRIEQGILGPPEEQYNVPTSEVENTATSLAQTLYLAYKNRGLLAMDRIKYRAAAAVAEAGDEAMLVEDARRALQDFDVALDHDPSDADLWRKAARVAAALNSARTKRYCLEAAIELDDDPAVAEVEPPSLSETLAGEQLKEQLYVLEDEVALSHPAMRPWITKNMSTALRRHLDPFPFLPDPSRELGSGGTGKETTEEGVEMEIRTASWTEIGEALVDFLQEEGPTTRMMRLRVLEPGEEVGAYSDGESDQEVSKVKSEDDEVHMEDGKKVSEEAKEEAKEDDKEATHNGEEGEAAKSDGRRKRSHSAAGIRDAAEDTVVEKRSKRIRRRDTALEEAVDPAAIKAEQLAAYQTTDQALFDMMGQLLTNVGVKEDMLELMAQFMAACGPERSSTKLPTVAMADLRDSLVSFKEDIAKVLTKKEPTIKDTAAADKVQERLLSLMDHVNGAAQDGAYAEFDDGAGAARFVAAVNREGAMVADVAYAWVLAMSASWTRTRWPEEVREAANKLVSWLNLAFYETVRRGGGECLAGRVTAAKVDRLVQMVFEQHLDMYADAMQPASIATTGDREEIRGWLRRWQELAGERTRSRQRTDKLESLDVRFLWGVVVSSTTLSHSPRDHTLHCWAELRDHLASHKHAAETLPNSTVVPTISAAAADREISKLTTMDFFISLFQHDHVKDPLHVIDVLEPVLNPSSVVMEMADGTATELVVDCASQQLHDIWKFLDSSTTELRLFLWTRLGEAYDQLGYRTKQFACHLACLSMLVAELDRPAYEATPSESRRALLYHVLKPVDEALTKALTLALNESTAFEIVDGPLIAVATAAVARLAVLLHVGMAYEDEVKVGMAHSGPAALTTLLVKLREMEIRSWCLQYALLRAASQIKRTPKETSPPPMDEKLAEFLTAIHNVLGMRKACNNSNKIFLHMVRVDLFKSRSLARWEDHVGQVLFDLYGLKLGASDLQDHGCVPEKITRRTTMQLIGKVVAMARRLPMRELLKSDLKTAIESLQLAIGQPKSNAQMVHNMRNYAEMFKKPIHPRRMFDALRCRPLTLDSVEARGPDAALAQHGWFFLLGTIALARYKMADLKKRQTPGATDDLRLGATWLKLQLQFTPDRWEAWFRLGECFDYELEDAVLWSADKINKDRGELVKLQRSAIHCYMMALSRSKEGNQWRGEEDEEEEPPKNVVNEKKKDDSTSESGSESDSESNPETPSKIEDAATKEALYELHHVFAMLVYSSSREPFAMEPFSHAEQRVVILEDASTKTTPMFDPISEYTAWRYAGELFRRAAQYRPREWKNEYMRAKCLWKMHCADDEGLSAVEAAHRPGVERLVEVLERAVRNVVALPRSRHSEQILEPHYKIVSLVNKLVVRGEMAVADGAEILSRQPFGVRLGGRESDDDDNNDDDDDKSDSDSNDESENERTPVDLADWKEYIIKNLRLLRDKDKAGWHHRIIMRHAHVVFGDADVSGRQHAMGAFNVLREGMFTKTMVMNVWKCDAERAGRHHVYTERYARFMVRLLVVTGDRQNLELLLKRLRKKGADFFMFADLWAHACYSYLRLLRDAYAVPTLPEDHFRSVYSAEFDAVGDRISTILSDPAAHTPAYECMRDAIELKKLNANLMRVGPIDDLIADCYGAIYFDIGRGGECTQDEKRDVSPLAEIGLRPTLESASVKPALDSASASGVATPAEAPKPRRPGIRRPEVLRKAETVLVRSMEPMRSAAVKVRVAVKSIPTSSRRGVPRIVLDSVKDNEGTSGVINEEENGHDDGDVGENGEDGENGENVDKVDAASVASTGSAQHFADDESDLSDVPEDDEMDDESTVYPQGEPIPVNNLGGSMAGGIGAATDTEMEEGGYTDDGIAGYADYHANDEAEEDEHVNDEEGEDEHANDEEGEDEHANDEEEEDEHANDDEGEDEDEDEGTYMTPDEGGAVVGP